MAEAKTQDPPKADKAHAAAKPTGEPTHIRFIGHPSDDEHSATEVFGKRFYRGKWVPLANLNGGNPEKKALDETQLRKLTNNPAFQLGHGEDSPIPGVTARGGVENQAEEA